MLNRSKLREWLGWPQIRAHLCTLAVSVGFPALWRGPREAFEFGGLQYGLAVTVAMVTVALPLVLLQLAIGQLSQQDAVGVWRAVPFFRGVGYLKLLVSFVTSTYTSIYLAVTVTYFLNTISISTPFADCIDSQIIQEETIIEERVDNGLACLNETFMAPVLEKPEYYLAEALIIATLWIVLPFIFYHPVKFMKRLFYLLGPVVVILLMAIGIANGVGRNLSLFVSPEGWQNFKGAGIWHAAVVQALVSTQVAGGYLISSADTVYANTNVQWSAAIITIVNTISTWFGLLFWYAISSSAKDTSMFAVLNQAYQFTDDTNFVWPIVIFFTLILSGFITMMALAFPIFDRVRRLGIQWRKVYFLGYLLAVGATLGVLAGRLLTLELLEEVAVPLIISVTTILEILPLIFIYGVDMLVDDINFLTGGAISRVWVYGWWVAPGVLLPISGWWLQELLVDEGWGQSWVLETVVSSAGVLVLIFVIFAGVGVAKQVQYDFCGKLRAAFKPSRHWGPRDPISHFYWLARKTDDRNNIISKFHRQQLGEFSGITLSEENIVKRRANSDDWLYTKKYRSSGIVESRTRSFSLDLSLPHIRTLQKKKIESIKTLTDSVVSGESVYDAEKARRVLEINSS